MSNYKYIAIIVILFMLLITNGLFTYFDISQLNIISFEKVRDLVLLLTYMRDHYDYYYYNYLIMNTIREDVYQMYEFTFDPLDSYIYKGENNSRTVYYLFMNLHMTLQKNYYNGSIEIPLINAYRRYGIIIRIPPTYLKSLNEKAKIYNAQVLILTKGQYNICRFRIFIHMYENSKYNDIIMNRNLFTKLYLITKYDHDILEININAIKNYIEKTLDILYTATNYTLPSNIRITIYYSAQDISVLNTGKVYEVFMDQINKCLRFNLLYDIKHHHIYLYQYGEIFPILIINVSSLVKLLNTNVFNALDVIYIGILFLYISALYVTLNRKNNGYLIILGMHGFQNYLAIILLIISVILILPASYISNDFLYVKVLNIVIIFICLGINDLILSCVEVKHTNGSKLKTITWLLFGIFISLVLYEVLIILTINYFIFRQFFSIKDLLGMTIQLFYHINLHIVNKQELITLLVVYYIMSSGYVVLVYDLSFIVGFIRLIMRKLLFSKRYINSVTN